MIGRPFTLTTSVLLLESKPEKSDAGYSSEAVLAGEAERHPQDEQGVVVDLRAVGQLKGIDGQHSSRSGPRQSAHHPDGAHTAEHAQQEPSPWPVPTENIHAMEQHGIARRMQPREGGQCPGPVRPRDRIRPGLPVGDIRQRNLVPPLDPSAQAQHQGERDHRPEQRSTMRVHDGATGKEKVTSAPPSA